MSVAILSAQEFGLFVALQLKAELIEARDLPKAIQLAALLAEGNARAFADSYSEIIDPPTVDDIERETLRYLADKSGRLVNDHFGPICYNIASQAGKAFLGNREIDGATYAKLRYIEKSAEAWQETQRRAVERQKENDQAYIDIGPLPLEDCQSIVEKCRSLNCDRIITATYSHDESDCMTDYFGSRSIRTVVIGFASGKKENFRQLRAAAAMFPPTAHMGPGFDSWRATVVFAEDCKANCYYYKGQKSPWHSDFETNQVFRTEAEARAFAESKGLPHSISVDGAIANFCWEFNCQSFEQRENWSMGGGNYLGTNRHVTGWTVRSTLVEHFANTDSRKIELLDIEHQAAAIKKAKPAKVKSVIVLSDTTETFDSGLQYRTLELQHGKTVASISKCTNPKGKPYFLVLTAKSRRGSVKAYWTIEAIESAYRSEAMQAIARHAGQVFNSQLPGK